jgi:hypothetical protein
MLASLTFRLPKYNLLDPCLPLAWRPRNFENEEGKFYVGFIDFSPVKTPRTGFMSSSAWSAPGFSNTKRPGFMLALLTFCLPKCNPVDTCLLLARPWIFQNLSRGVHGLCAQTKTKAMSCLNFQRFSIPSDVWFRSWLTSLPCSLLLASLEYINLSTWAFLPKALYRKLDVWNFRIYTIPTDVWFRKCKIRVRCSLLLCALQEFRILRPALFFLKVVRYLVMAGLSKSFQDHYMWA